MSVVKLYVDRRRARERVNTCRVNSVLGSKDVNGQFEKVLLGKWSAIAMLELQRIWFAGWALTEGQLAMPRLSSGV